MHSNLTVMDYLNRKEHPLPDFKCVIKIIHQYIDGPFVLLCIWEPDENEAIIGTARVIYGQHIGIGLHVYKSTDHEFIWYQIVDMSLGQHNNEGEITKAQLMEDIAFLTNMQYRLGLSAHSLICIAYGKIPLSMQRMPYDQYDFKNLESAWMALPDHRRKSDAAVAFERAKRAFSKYNELGEGD